MRLIKVYDNYNFRENSFDNEEVRTEWIMIKMTSEKHLLIH